MNIFTKILIKINNLFTLDVENLVNYIYQAETLPEPLNEFQEDKLLKLLKTADHIYAKNQLIEHNLRLVLYITKKYENTGISQEDLVSVGSIGLIKAVESFDVNKNIKLATYASRCIENEILMYLRKANKTANTVSIDEPITVESDGKILTVADIIASDDSSPEEKIKNGSDVSFLIDSLSKLNKREQLIIKMRFGIEGYKEYTQKEVADILNISQSYISRLEKKIINKLKRYMYKNA